MASCDPFDSEQAFALRLKSMADDELLEAWEETVQLEIFIDNELQVQTNFGMDYEKDILEELQLRTVKRIART